jgi:acetolactate synthase-1/2/3 large subunit
VVAVSGDGGFLMNVQELETAKRLGLAIVNVIFRDGGYNLIQWKQQSASATWSARSDRIADLTSGR